MLPGGGGGSASGGPGCGDRGARALSAPHGRVPSEGRGGGVGLVGWSVGWVVGFLLTATSRSHDVKHGRLGGVAGRGRVAFEAVAAFWTLGNPLPMPNREIVNQDLCDRDLAHCELPLHKKGFQSKMPSVCCVASFWVKENKLQQPNCQRKKLS